MDSALGPRTMFPSAGGRVFEQLQDAVKRYRRAGTFAFALTLALGLLTIVLWPDGAPVYAFIAGIGAALAAGIFVPWLLDRRAPWFSSREDVERVLGLPVLAEYSPRRER